MEIISGDITSKSWWSWLKRSRRVFQRSIRDTTFRNFVWAELSTVTFHAIQDAVEPEPANRGCFPKSTVVRPRHHFQEYSVYTKCPYTRYKFPALG